MRWGHTKRVIFRAMPDISSSKFTKR